MSKYLVTGGGGFIGSNIVGELLQRREEVRILDNFSTGRRENIAEFSGEVEVIEGDIRDLRTVEKSVEGVDFVLHQAALPSVQRSILNPLTTNEVNITGTLNLLLASRAAKVRRFVYASSSSVYGDSAALPKSEDMSPHPLSPYAISKLAGERYCQAFYDLYGLETVCLRYFNVFGPKQDPLSEYSAVIPKFIRALAQKRSPEIYGDGEQTRDFTYVQNVVLANLLASSAKGVAGEAINIACGERFSLNQMLKYLQGVFDSAIDPIYTDPRPGEVRDSLADISKARKLLGYEPQVSFFQGLKRTLNCFVR
jgi:nucleoside-diphosphate-sugar epimerase